MRRREFIAGLSGGGGSIRVAFCAARAQQPERMRTGKAYLAKLNWHAHSRLRPKPRDWRQPEGLAGRRPALACGFDGAFRRPELVALDCEDVDTRDLSELVLLQRDNIAG
jgi:hypothetical protein